MLQKKKKKIKKDKKHLTRVWGVLTPSSDYYYTSTTVLFNFHYQVIAIIKKMYEWKISNENLNNLKFKRIEKTMDISQFEEMVNFCFISRALKIP